MSTSPRYVQASEHEYKILENLLYEVFSPEYSQLKIKILMDLKGKKGLFATIRATNPLLEHFADCDYVVTITQRYWDVLHHEDQKRIMRHELRHIHLTQSRNGDLKCGIREHEITDFYEDVELESLPDGDLRWHERIAAIASSIDGDEQ